MAFNTILSFEHPFWDDAGGYDKYESAVDAARAESEEYAYGRPFQVLGHPTPMQTTVQYEIACAERPGDYDSENAARKRITREPWELLLTAIDYIDDSSLYVMIRRNDLEARRWDEARYVVQST